MTDTELSMHHSILWLASDAAFVYVVVLRSRCKDAVANGTGYRRNS